MLLVAKLPGFVWTGLRINSRKSQEVQVGRKRVVMSGMIKVERVP